MKVIIAGSRSITDYYMVKRAYEDSGFAATEIVSGGARGVDKLGEWLANDKGLPCTIFPAAWDKLGKSAGYVRNMEMVEYADALIAVYDGTSKGTAHTIALAKKKGIPVFVVQQKGEEK